MGGAEQLYRRVVAQAPGAAVTRGLLAEVYLRQQRNDEAVQVLKDGVTHDPSSPLMHRSLASVLDRTGRLREAVQEYREYARLAPNAGDAKQLQERATYLEQKAASSSL